MAMQTKQSLIMTIRRTERWSVLTFFVLGALALGGCDATPDRPPSAAGVAISPFPSIENLPRARGAFAAAQAATAFLDTLATDQRAIAVLPLTGDARARWSNLPAGIVDFDRNGVRIGDLDETQLRAFFELVAASLSADGYRTVADIVTADKILADKLLAGPLGWTDENYWVSFFGEPTPSGAWMLQLSGHHLAMNVAFDEAKIIGFSPTFLGVEPAAYEFAGTASAPFTSEIAAVLDLVRSLDEEQRRTASLDELPDDVATGAGRDGFIPPTTGIPVARWSTEQRARLLNLIGEWVDVLPDDARTARLADIAADLDQTYFSWFGSLPATGKIYFRVQGPRLVLEFLTESNVGADEGHFHSMYRDPTREYGGFGAMN